MTRPLIPKRLAGAAYMPPNVDVIAEHECLGRQTEGQLHWHDFHKLVYIADGSGIHLMNGVPYAISPGIGFLLAPLGLPRLAAGPRGLCPVQHPVLAAHPVAVPR
jgi:hypothetical protein